MKQALVMALATFGLTAAAFAQSPNTDISPGPHNPNPPMEAPDLRLPAPCAPTPDLAAAGAVAMPDAAQRTIPAAGRITPVEAGTTQCSANGITQSAALPPAAPAQ